MEDVIKQQLTEAVHALESGGVIVYPTDTVYGLGADATNPKAVEFLRTIKGKDADKPILAMVSDIDMLEQYACVTPLARKLAEQFLPGPLSLVLEAKDESLQSIQSMDGSLGFRVPRHNFCLNLCKIFGKPITSTSMNRSGLEQPRTLEAMLQQLGEYTKDIRYIVDMGLLPESAPSTVVDARGTAARVMREGAILESTLAPFL